MLDRDEMKRESAFYYRCGECGRCCHDKVITLSPYDVTRMARAAGISTGDIVARYTLRRGSILRFEADGACPALRGARCTIHPGRPLACRLYPLGIERADDGERFIRLQPAEGSLGVYGDHQTVGDFLVRQETQPYLDAIAGYERLIAVFRARLDEVVDFERIEPRAFYRRAVREALAESNYDPNPLIDALFDSDRIAGSVNDERGAIDAHVSALEAMIRNESNADRLAAASALLAVSLGHSPIEQSAG
ncbi:MAG: YkgJ family cysteine cluster protein [Candidatus Binataceae bacterium]|jgi:Fe-S-cluster containining protein